MVMSHFSDLDIVQFDRARSVQCRNCSSEMFAAAALTVMWELVIAGCPATESPNSIVTEMSMNAASNSIIQNCLPGPDLALKLSEG
jgi:hypothetical protein